MGNWRTALTEQKSKPPLRMVKMYPVLMAVFSSGLFAAPKYPQGKRSSHV